jgi:hypothetical protein
MILYHKEPKTLPKKFLDTINSYSKVAGYKVNIQKSLAFLYTNNKKTEKEYNGNNSIYNSLKKKKSNT